MTVQVGFVVAKVSQISSVFTCQYNPTSVPYLFIYLPLTLHSLDN